MKKTIGLMCLAAMALAAPATAPAQRGPQAETLFRCALGNGKTVNVTARGDQVTYRYGTTRRAELTLTANPRSGNAHFMYQRYASIESQLRFTNGQYSYVVYSMGPSQVAQSNGVSGLVVFRGTRRIADHSCRRFTEFSGGFELMPRFPEDSETYSAM